jgi:hypothetical protein
MGRSLSNGALSVTFKGHGGIREVEFGNDGAGWYLPGVPVADTVLQRGFAASYSTFGIARNSLESWNGDVNSLQVCGTASTLRYVAETSWGLRFCRSWQLVAGLNVLRAVTTLTNTTSMPLDVLFADAYDPDPDITGDGEDFEDFGTLMDVISISVLGSSRSAALATGPDSGQTVVMGSNQPAVIVSSGGDFDILQSHELVNFINNPVNAGGAELDTGMQVGVKVTIQPSQSYCYDFRQAYGSSPASARSAYSQSWTNVPPLVP